MALTRIPLVCDECGEAFCRPLNQVKPHLAHAFCSQKCCGAYKAKNQSPGRGEDSHNWKPREFLTCEMCGDLFQLARKHRELEQRFCSRKCGHTWFTQNSSKREYVCEVCEEQFFLFPSRVRVHEDRGHKVRFCSMECSHNREKAGPSKNKKARRTPEYTSWRKDVYARDNWTCQECDKRGGELHAHHVFSVADFPEHRLEAWNGVTLCKECHASMHPDIGLFANVRSMDLRRG